MDDVALPLARSGPLVSPLTIVALGALVLAALILARRHLALQRRPWLAGETAVVAVLGLIHLLFFWQPYRTGALVPGGGGDMTAFYYPLHAYAARTVQDGSLPFWNPHLFSGAPHLANFQTALLYPPNLLAYLLFRPFDYAALELLVLAHYLAASYGAYWLARALGMGRPGAVLAGSLYAYSGFLVAHLGHYPIVATAAWAPWLLAAIVAAVRRDSWLIALLGVPALTLTVLAGHQPTLLLALTAAVALAAFEVWRVAGGPHAPARHIKRLLAMGALALAVCAPVLGPSFEQNRYTVRGELNYATASEYAVQPVALIHLVLPTVFGSNPTDYWGPFSNTEIWGYTGVLALALAGFGVAAQWSRTRAFWLLSGLAALLFLLGPFASLHGWAYAFVPGYDRVRAAGRGYMLFDLSVAVLAGCGLEALRRGVDGWTERERRALTWGLLGLGGALAAVVLVVIPLLASRVLGVNDPGNRPVIALDNANLLAIWLALGLGVAVAAWRGALRGGALTVAVLAVVLLDTFHATSPFNPTTAPILAGYAHQDSVEFLRERYAQDGPFRIEVMTADWQPSLALLAGLDDISGAYDPLALAAYDRYRSAAVTDRASARYAQLNVRYIVADAGQGRPQSGYVEAFRSPDGIVLWEAPDWRPRAWIDGSDAVLEIEEDGPNSLTVRLPPNSPAGRLVISQVAYPGWRATVDGEDAAVATFDGALQTIELPPDARVIELDYAPRRFRLWLAVALLGMLSWIVGMGLVLRGWRVAVARLPADRRKEPS